jgi:hypothetical protein
MVEPSHGSCSDTTTELFLLHPPVVSAIEDRAVTTHSVRTHFLFQCFDQRPEAKSVFRM